MNRRIKITLSLALVFTAISGWAYEASTHRILTAQAIKRSILQTSNTLLSDLGLPTIDTIAYVNSKGVRMSGRDIIVFGAQHEDEDYQYRAFNHFFDPQTNRPSGRGLEFIIVNGNRSPDWALEDRNEVLDHHDGHCGPRGTGCPQYFSLRNAQHSLFDALTKESPADRMAAASRALQSLGHIVHHVQDMAQPQHTRNDQHAHPIETPIVDINPAWSYYERRTEMQNSAINVMLETDYQGNTGYPIPTLATARQFWHTPTTSEARYVGMAEFTSNNFVSYGTQFSGLIYDAVGKNIGSSPGYPLPNGEGKQIVRLDNPQITSVKGVVIPPGKADYVQGTVYDGYTNTSKTAILAATSLTSIFTGFGTSASVRTFVENSHVYDDQYKILLPRAVAFSAGLINHFFRGKLNISKGSSASQWTLSNSGGDAFDGTFYVFWESATGARQLIPNGVQRNPPNLAEPRISTASDSWICAASVAPPVAWI